MKQSSGLHLRAGLCCNNYAMGGNLQLQDDIHACTITRVMGINTV